MDPLPAHVNRDAYIWDRETTPPPGRNVAGVPGYGQYQAAYDYQAPPNPQPLRDAYIWDRRSPTTAAPVPAPADRDAYIWDRK